MRWDSPPVLVVIGTLAVHTLLLTAGDAIATYNKYEPEPPVVFETFDIAPPEVPPTPPPPPLTPPDVKPPDPAPPPVAAPPARVRTSTPRPATPAPPIDPPLAPANASPDPNAGGSEPTIPMQDLGPAAHGTGAAVGGPVRHGHGGHGAGRGSGEGAGSGEGVAPPVPMSVASIKTRALPRGDYSYFGAGKDYPAEAKTLAIEGVIKVRLLVDAGGKVSSATLLGKLGHGLDELALRYAHAIVFEPARDTDDHPVASVVVWTFQFTLPR